MNGLDDEQYGIKCKFGRFGQSSGTYINETTILCLTPNIEDDPADISEEEVQVTPFRWHWIYYACRADIDPNSRWTSCM